MRSRKTSSAASSTSCAPARAPRRRADGRPSCMLSGECIKACDYGVNPRFLLAMARLAMAKADKELPERRRQGVEKYREIGHDVTVLSRLQLDGEVLERLGQKSASVAKPARGAGFRVLYRLQRAEDAAYRAACPRHHGCARHLLPGDGRAEPLLRRHAAAHRRHRDVRPHGLEHDREAVALEFRPGDLLVPELLRPVHGNHAADAGAAARRAAVRDDAVHALPARPARPS